MNKQNELIDLGCVNGWKECPEKYTKCHEAKHALDSKSIGVCYTEYTCAICGIKWQVDSGD